MTPSRKNRDVTHEHGTIESPHGHLKPAILDDRLELFVAETPLMKLTSVAPGASSPKMADERSR
ncbi:hypothetical protein [Acidiphilium multivorum]|uniref:hypothetical protein n=1 Tax=Acidiphilium multivorum TaxID=62140 RepID=UPI001B8B0800|nr:hypothetical protein [Acidiphilium multivorum]MBS3025480.1 hypothetical protein [Acidiphilium multivorum]